MKKYLLFLFLLVSNSYHVRANPQNEIPDSDRIIAKVENKNISAEEYKRRAGVILASLKNTAKKDFTEEQAQRLRKIILDILINEKLLIVEAENQNIKVSLQETKEAYRDIRDNRFESKREFRNKLKETEFATDQEYKNHIRDQLKARKLIDKEIGKGTDSIHSKKQAGYDSDQYKNFLTTLRKKHNIEIFIDPAKIDLE